LLLRIMLLNHAAYLACVHASLTVNAGGSISSLLTML
jgi:hypothetical protein